LCRQDRFHGVSVWLIKSKDTAQLQLQLALHKRLQATAITPTDNPMHRHTIPSLTNDDGEVVMADYSVISSDKVEGTSVYNATGEKLGSIDDLMIDRHSGQVKYAVLEFGGFLGMGTDRYPIPWTMLKYDTQHSGYVVPLDKAKLEKAPKYTDNQIPTYDTAYSSKVNSYYDSRM
jgi:sporulation protein YlmC with PRC-barrel domain